jgi:hypothetical protein
MVFNLLYPSPAAESYAASRNSADPLLPPSPARSSGGNSPLYNRRVAPDGQRREAQKSGQLLLAEERLNRIPSGKLFKDD